MNEGLESGDRRFAAMVALKPVRLAKDGATWPVAGCDANTCLNAGTSALLRCWYWYWRRTIVKQVRNL
ncbi:MAG: hypothetical protein U0487_00660 [Patescibacteria group bacterium]